VENAMQRITITLDDDLAAAIDRIVGQCGYQNRSEAIRDLARAGMRQAAEEGGAPGVGKSGAESVAALVYVYDHDARQLARRLTHSFHEHHSLTLATMHVHLDHESCMEVTVLRGQTAEVRHIADHVIAERGVRHGRLVLVPVAVEALDHSHGGGSHRHDHIHVRHAG
jgi:CopG family transcriptional regulator, nickel-responsive regulator